MGACVNASDLTKSALIQPQGFQIAQRATDCHGITHKHASKDGTSLADTLVEFMRDVSTAILKGGRVCAHQLEFDAGVIAAELLRCGFLQLHNEWVRIARCGYCTMNPEVGRWLKEYGGEDVGLETTQWTFGLIKLSLKLGVLKSEGDHDAERAVAKFGRHDIYQDGKKIRHHSAEYDAKLTRLIYIDLLRRAKQNDITSKHPAGETQPLHQPLPDPTHAGIADGNGASASDQFTAVPAPNDTSFIPDNGDCGFATAAFLLKRNVPLYANEDLKQSTLRQYLAEAFSAEVQRSVAEDVENLIENVAGSVFGGEPHRGAPGASAEVCPHAGRERISVSGGRREAGNDEGCNVWNAVFHADGGLDVAQSISQRQLCFAWY